MIAARMVAAATDQREGARRTSGRVSMLPPAPASGRTQRVPVDGDEGMAANGKPVGPIGLVRNRVYAIPDFWLAAERNLLRRDLSTFLIVPIVRIGGAYADHRPVAVRCGETVDRPTFTVV